MAASFNITAKLQLQAGNFQPVISSLQQQLKGFTANVNVGVNPVSTRGVAAMTAQVTALRNNITNVNKNLGQVSQTVNHLGQSNLNQFGKQLGQLANAATGLQHNISGAGSELYRLGQQAAVSGRRYLAFSLGAVSFVKLAGNIHHAADEALEFQHNLVRLSQLGAVSNREVGEVSDTITGLSTSLGVSSKELSDVTIYLKGAGLNVTEVKDALEALSKTSLAPTFKDIRSTTEGLLSLRSQFKLSSKDYADVLGSINNVAREFAAESEDIIEAVRRSGAAFKASAGDLQSPKQSLNEFIALFTSVRATTRESAESIATALRTVFANLQSNKVVKSLQEMGINLRYTREEAAATGQNLENQFVGEYKAIQRISQALKGIPTTDPRFASVVDQIGGVRQVSRVIPLLTEFGTAQKAYSAAVSGTTSLTRDADKAQDAFIVRLSKLHEAFSALVREISQSQFFGGLIDSLTQGANAAIQLGRALEPLVPLLTTLAAIKIGANLVSFARGFGSQIANPRQRFATGGIVSPNQGGGASHSDSVHAYVPQGAFIIRAPIARKLPSQVKQHLISEDNTRTNTHRLVPVSIMPGEIVVPPGRAAQYAGALHNINKGYNLLPHKNKYASGGHIIDYRRDKRKSISHFNEISEEYANYLPEHLKSAIRDYSGGFYNPVNKKLRFGQPSFDSDLLIPLLIQATQSHQLKHPLVVYRGTSEDEIKSYGLHKGKTVIDRGFLSTSIEPESADIFNEHNNPLSRIILPRGIKAAPIGELSQHSHEKEIILPPETPLRFLGHKDNFLHFKALRHKYAFGGFIPKTIRFGASIGEQSVAAFHRKNLFKGFAAGGKPRFRDTQAGRKKYASGGLVRLRTLAENMGIDSHNYGKTEFDEDVKTRIKELGLSETDLLNATGVLPGSDVSATVSGGRGINIGFIHPMGEGFRSIATKDNRIVRIDNNSFDAGDQGKGVATLSYARQILYGPNKPISLYAIGNKKTMKGGSASGYYVWPTKFGAEGTLPEEFTRHAPPHVKTVQQLLSLPHGHDLWKKYGSDISLTLDPTNRLVRKRLRGLKRRGFAQGGIIKGRRQYSPMVSQLLLDRFNIPTRFNSTAGFVRMLRGEDANKIVSHLPEGSQFLGSGTDAVTYLTPGREVIRIGGVGANEKRRDQFLSRGRPQDRYTLQPLESHQYGQYTVEKLPYAPDLNRQFPKGSKRRDFIIKAFHNRLLSQGKIPHDVKASNLSVYGRRVVAIDPDTYRAPINKEELESYHMAVGSSDELRAKSLKGAGFAQGGQVGNNITSLPISSHIENTGFMRSGFAQMLESEHAHQISSHIPAGSSIIGSGTDAVAFKTPQNYVVRLGGLGRGEEVRSSDRPNHPLMLPSVGTYKYGRYTVEEVPFAPTLENKLEYLDKGTSPSGQRKYKPQRGRTEKRIDRIHEAFMKRLHKLGLEPVDVLRNNLGWYNRSIVGIDPELFRATGGFVGHMSQHTSKLFSREMRANYETMLSGEHAAAIAQHIPHQAEYLDSGTDAIVFKAPDGDVIRVGGLGYQRSSDRPRHPLMLPAKEVHKYGDYTVEKLPFAPSIKKLLASHPKKEKLGSRIEQLFTRRLVKEGKIPTDVSVANLGLHQGKIVGIDPEMYREQDDNNLLPRRYFLGGFVSQKRRDKIKESLGQQFGPDIDFSQFAGFRHAFIPTNRAGQFVPYGKTGPEVQIPRSQLTDQILGHEYAHAGDYIAAQNKQYKALRDKDLPYASAIPGHPFNLVAKAAIKPIYTKISDPKFYQRQAKAEGLDEEKLHHVESFASALQAYGERQQYLQAGYEEHQLPTHLKSQASKQVFSLVESTVLPHLAHASNLLVQRRVNITPPLPKKQSLVGRVFGAIRGVGARGLASVRRSSQRGDETRARVEPGLSMPDPTPTIQEVIPNIQSPPLGVNPAKQAEELYSNLRFQFPDLPEHDFHSLLAADPRTVHIAPPGHPAATLEQIAKFTANPQPVPVVQPEVTASPILTPPGSIYGPFTPIAGDPEHVYAKHPESGKRFRIPTHIQHSDELITGHHAIMSTALGGIYGPDVIEQAMRESPIAQHRAFVSPQSSKNIKLKESPLDIISYDPSTDPRVNQKKLAQNRTMEQLHGLTNPSTGQKYTREIADPKSNTFESEPSTLHQKQRAIEERVREFTLKRLKVHQIPPLLAAEGLINKEQLGFARTGRSEAKAIEDEKRVPDIRATKEFLADEIVRERIGQTNPQSLENLKAIEAGQTQKRAPEAFGQLAGTAKGVLKNAIFTYEPKPHVADPQADMMSQYRTIGHIIKPFGYELGEPEINAKSIQAKVYKLGQSLDDAAGNINNITHSSESLAQAEQATTKELEKIDTSNLRRTPTKKPRIREFVTEPRGSLSLIPKPEVTGEGRIQGYRGVRRDEIRSLADVLGTEQAYQSRDPKMQHIYFAEQSGERAQFNAAGYAVSQTNDPKGRGFLLNLDVPSNIVENDPATGVPPENKYRRIPALHPDFVPTYRRVRPNPEENYQGGMPTLPPIYGKEKPLLSLLERYNRYRTYITNKRTQPIDITGGAVPVPNVSGDVVEPKTPLQITHQPLGVARNIESIYTPGQTFVPAPQVAPIVERIPKEGRGVNILPSSGVVTALPGPVTKTSLPTGQAPPVPTTQVQHDTRKGTPTPIVNDLPPPPIATGLENIGHAMGGAMRGGYIKTVAETLNAGKPILGSDAKFSLEHFLQHQHSTGQISKYSDIDKYIDVYYQMKEKAQQAKTSTPVPNAGQVEPPTTADVPTQQPKPEVTPTPKTEDELLAAYHQAGGKSYRSIKEVEDRIRNRATKSKKTGIPVYLLNARRAEGSSIGTIPEKEELFKTVGSREGIKVRVAPTNKSKGLSATHPHYDPEDNGGLIANINQGGPPKAPPTGAPVPPPGNNNPNDPLAAILKQILTAIKDGNKTKPTKEKKEKAPKPQVATYPDNFHPYSYQNIGKSRPDIETPFDERVARFKADKALQRYRTNISLPLGGTPITRPPDYLQTGDEISIPQRGLEGYLLADDAEPAPIPRTRKPETQEERIRRRARTQNRDEDFHVNEQRMMKEYFEENRDFYRGGAIFDRSRAEYAPRNVPIARGTLDRNILAKQLREQRANNPRYQERLAYQYLGSSSNVPIEPDVDTYNVAPVGAIGNKNNRTAVERYIDETQRRHYASGQSGVFSRKDIENELLRQVRKTTKTYGGTFAPHAYGINARLLAEAHTEIAGHLGVLPGQRDTGIPIGPPPVTPGQTNSLGLRDRLLGRRVAGFSGKSINNISGQLQPKFANAVKDLSDEGRGFLMSQLRNVAGGNEDLVNQVVSGDANVILNRQGKIVDIRDKQRQQASRQRTKGFFTGKKSPVLAGVKNLFTPKPDYFVSPLSDEDELQFELAKAQKDADAAKIASARDDLIQKRGGPRRVRRPSRLGRVSQLGLGIGAVAAQFAPEVIEGITGNVENPGIGGLAGVRAGRGFGGALSGGAIGVSVGSFLGPWGIAIGGAVGALHGFITATKEADKEIRAVKLDRSFKQLDIVIEDILSNRTSVAQGIGQVRSQFSDIGTVEAESNRRNDPAASYRRSAVNALFQLGSSTIGGGLSLTSNILHQTGITKEDYAQKLGDKTFGKDQLLGSQGFIQRNILGGPDTLQGAAFNSLVGERGAVGQYFSEAPEVTAKKRYADYSKFIRENNEPRVGQLRAINEKLAGDIKLNPDLLRNTDVRGNVLSQDELEKQRQRRLDVFKSSGGGDIANKIVEATPGLTLDKYYKEMDNYIVEVNKARVAQINLTKVINQQAIEFQKFARIGNTIDATIASMENLQNGLDATEAAFSGSLQPIKAYSHAAGAENIGGLDNPAHAKAISFVTKSLRGNLAGPASQLVDSFGETSTHVNTLKNSLPSIINTAASQGDLSGKGIELRINEGINALGDIPDVIKNRLSKLLNSIGSEELAKQAGENVDKLASNLLKDGFANVDEVLTDAAKKLAESTNQYNADLIKSQEMLNRIGEEQDRYADLQVKATQSSASIYAERRGRPSQAHLLVPLSAELAPIQQRQERLTGPLLQGEDANNPELIKKRLQDVRGRIERQIHVRDNAPDQPAQIEASKGLVSLQNEAYRLGQALEHLRDPTERNAILQERLNRIEESRNAKLSFTEKIATASPQERVQMQRNAAFSDIAVRQGSLVGLHPQIAAGALEHLSSLGEAELPGYDNIKASDLHRQLLINTARQSGILTPHDERQRANIIQAQDRNNQIAVGAQGAIVADQQRGQAEFSNKLENRQGEFRGRLAGGFVQSARQDITAQISENQDTLKKAQAAQQSAAYFGGIGTGFSPEQVRVAQTKGLGDVSDLLRTQKSLGGNYTQAQQDISDKNSNVSNLIEKAFVPSPHVTPEERDRARVEGLPAYFNQTLGIPHAEVGTSLLPDFEKELQKTQGPITPEVARNTFTNFLSNRLPDHARSINDKIEKQAGEISKGVFGGNDVTPKQLDAVKELASRPPLDVQAHLKATEGFASRNDIDFQVGRSQGIAENLKKQQQEVGNVAIPQPSQVVAPPVNAAAPILKSPALSAIPSTIKVDGITRQTFTGRVVGAAKRDKNVYTPEQISNFQQQAGLQLPAYDVIRQNEINRAKALRAHGKTAQARTVLKNISRADIQQENIVTPPRNLPIPSKIRIPETIDVGEYRRKTTTGEVVGRRVGNTDTFEGAAGKDVNTYTSAQIADFQRQAGVQIPSNEDIRTNDIDRANALRSRGRNTQARNIQRNVERRDKEMGFTPKAPTPNEDNRNQRETDPMAAFGQNIQALNGVIGGFDKTISNMGTTLSNLANVFKDLHIPEAIEVNVGGRQEVVINGAQLLAALQGQIAETVGKNLLEQFRAEIPKLIKNMPAV